MHPRSLGASLPGRFGMGREGASEALFDIVNRKCAAATELRPSRGRARSARLRLRAWLSLWPGRSLKRVSATSGFWRNEPTLQKRNRSGGERAPR